MKLQVGEIVMNKTYRFLFPCLKNFGEEFKERIDSVWKSAIGVGDMAMSELGISYNQHLFILIDTGIAKKHFIAFMDWIRSQPMYATDYPYGDISTGHLHMVVIKLPDNCTKALEALKRGQYSSMYSKEEIDILFPLHKIRSRKILTEDPSYKASIVAKLNKIWETSITPEEYDGEVELPFQQEEEFFNFKKENK